MNALPDRRAPLEPHHSGITLDSALLRQAVEETTSSTFEYQDSLPRLPIPALDESLNKLLRHLEPLQDHQSKARSQEIVLEFMKGDGPKLQKLLLQYEANGLQSGQLGSYLEEFWNDPDEPIDASDILKLNPFFVLENSTDPETSGDQIGRAASLCFAALKMVSELVHETLPVDRNHGKPLCMDQFRALFGTARIPNLDGSDDIDVYTDSSHVLVLCQSQIYYFPAMWPDGSLAVDKEDIFDILESLRRNAKSFNPIDSAASSLGIFTALDRRNWANVRQELSKSSKNKNYLTIVDSALFVIVLDDYVPENIDDAASNLFHGSYQLQTPKNHSSSTGHQVGSCCNRWYDKLQIIVCGDGTAGVSFTDSSVDAHTAERFASDIYAQTVVDYAQAITRTPGGPKIPNVLRAEVNRSTDVLDEHGMPRLDVFAKKLHFVLSPDIKQKLSFAETVLGDHIAAIETQALDFKDFGKLLLLGNNLDPDAFVQMGIMVSYYRIYGKVVCGYEPVSTKTFYHGRTEAMRPATSESRKLCEVMCDPSSSSQQKLSALRRATEVHEQYVRECMRGKGADRHLFALKCIAELNHMPTPSFFHSEPWKLLNRTILSTSSCRSTSLRLFGLGPAVVSGFGIGYIITENSIRFCISSKKRQTKRFVSTLIGMLKNMAKLLKRSKYTAGRPVLRRKPVVPSPEGFDESWNSGVMSSNHAQARTDAIDRWLDRNSDHVRHVAHRSTSCPAVIVDNIKWQHGENDSDGEVQRIAPPPVVQPSVNHIGLTESQHQVPPLFDSQPQVPMRRNSMFAGCSRRQSLTAAQMSESVLTLDDVDDDDNGAEQ